MVQIQICLDIYMIIEEQKSLIELITVEDKATNQ